ncbi:MAG: peptidoglycan editing factor PgeF [Rhodovibrionaceae bacterium]
MLTMKPLSEQSRVRHGFFTRQGGVSSGIYSSLNCGFGSGDDPDKVATNRARVTRELGVDKTVLVTLYQHHSADVVEVAEPWERGDSPEADAMVTKQPEIALGILAADCAPVLLADGKAGVIGAAHAGWRGALSRVLENTVAKMVELGAAKQDIVAVIGPCIAQRSYEVGPEFPERFLAQNEENAQFFYPGVRSGHYFFDLKSYATRRLKRAGIGEVRAIRADTCTEEDRFFSYRRSVRRGEEDYGRQLSVIYLEP